MSAQSKAKLDEASIAGFADHDIITPKHNLKGFSRKVKARYDEHGFDLDALERAEAALAELSTEFDDWMRKEVVRLGDARDVVKRGGLGPETRPVLYRAAHDIRGQAATFGYPLAASVADSLCRLLDGIADDRRVPVGLVSQHVDAIGAIVREQATGADNRTALTLSERLASVVNDLLVQIEGSPSIAP
ncbi:Hpt domain-containing protein [Phreatobacter sp.]|uniref:Hpt domain-containing protein n=1 Tax=Phreatobacter sp. TaxID=1966341 RepID=UPI003F6EA751